MSKATRPENFIQLCLEGHALLDEIDDYVDRWHDSDSTLELHEFLGMTLQEYAAWVKCPDMLAAIVTGRKRRESFLDIYGEFQNERIAARGVSPADVTEVVRALKCKEKIKK
jgi:hypothetical protein